MNQVKEMIKYIQGDLFRSPAQVLVNTVNTDGVMGKGIALKFKKLYPDMFHKYKVLCENKQLNIGKLWLYKADDHIILNFPTKMHWRNPSKLEYIELGLKKFIDTYQDKGITSIAFPRLGCGNGGLDWFEVKKMMEQYLDPLPIEIYVYEQELKDEKMEHENIISMRKWLEKDAKNMPYQEFYEDLKSELIKMDIDAIRYEYDFRTLWTKLCNNEYVVLSDIFQSDETSDIIKAIENLCYIEKCKIKRNGDFINAAYLRYHKILKEASNL